MDIYLAGGEGHHRKQRLVERHLVDGKADLKILFSFYYANELTEWIIPRVKKFILDSGAFTFMFANGSEKVDFNDYLTKYIDFINKNDVKLFLELDVDSVIGYENVLKLRKRLEMETGKKCIPVWHFSRGKEEFLKMCDEYDYVAFGGLMSDGFSVHELMKVMPWFVNEAHKRGAKIHGLGFTNLKGLEKIKFDSVDSTAWVSGNRFGGVYRFNGRTMEKIQRKPGQRMTNCHELAINNFDEWVKFQKYAEKFL